MDHFFKKIYEARIARGSVVFCLVLFFFAFLFTRVIAFSSGANVKLVGREVGSQGIDNQGKGGSMAVETDFRTTTADGGKGACLGCPISFVKYAQAGSQINPIESGNFPGVIFGANKGAEPGAVADVWGEMKMVKTIATHAPTVAFGTGETDEEGDLHPEWLSDSAHKNAPSDLGDFKIEEGGESLNIAYDDLCMGVHELDSGTGDAEDPDSSINPDSAVDQLYICEEDKQGTYYDVLRGQICKEGNIDCYYVWYVRKVICVKGDDPSYGMSYDENISHDGALRFFGKSISGKPATLTMSQNGRIGVSTTTDNTISEDLNVGGLIYTAEGILFPGETIPQTTAGGVPSGTISFFDKSECPNGWEPAKDKDGIGVTGRYMVSLPAGGTIGAPVGVALTSQENRPAGTHKHDLSDPGHFHQVTNAYNLDGREDGGGGPSHNSSGSKTTVYVNSAATGVTFGQVSLSDPVMSKSSGTPAPYVQFLACRKL